MNRSGNTFCGRTRREFLWEAGAGFTGIGLVDLLSRDGFFGNGDGSGRESPLAPKPPHHPARAKAVIFLFMYGGPSQVDTFDYKPKLYPLDGKTIDIDTKGRGGSKNKPAQTEYFHTMLAASMVAPGHDKVIPLEPEFIVPQDGADKQDCENAAAKRWLAAHGRRYAEMGAVFLGDDLFSRQPLCEAVQGIGGSFIFVCKPASHALIEEYVTGAELPTLDVPVRRGKQRYIHRHRWLADVPLRDGKDALVVNWLAIDIIDAKGKVTYRNSFVTDLPVTSDTVVELAAAGRARGPAPGGARPDRGSAARRGRHRLGGRPSPRQRAGGRERSLDSRHAIERCRPRARRPDGRLSGWRDPASPGQSPPSRRSEKNSHIRRVASMSSLLGPTRHSGSALPPGQVWPPPSTV